MTGARERRVRAQRHYFSSLDMLREAERQRLQLPTKIIIAFSLPTPPERYFSVFDELLASGNTGYLSVIIAPYHISFSMPLMPGSPRRLTFNGCASMPPSCRRFVDYFTFDDDA
jgi:hypothetical protein